MKRFPLDKNYAILLAGQNISISEIMKRARLPEDLFSRKDAGLTTEEYLRFMESIGESIKGTDLPVRLATAEQIESINPPIFAAYCSQDASHYMKRTLQRKLSEENTTFQKQLNHTRELMAKNYLQNTDLPSEDIAFLLGYQDVSSFFRAFSL